RDPGLEQRAELRLRQRALDGLHGLTLLEKHESGNRLDAVARRRLRRFVDVDLHDRERVTELGRNLLERGRHAHARPAPGRPEIDEPGLGGLEHEALETIVLRLLQRHAIEVSVDEAAWLRDLR